MNQSSDTRSVLLPLSSLLLGVGLLVVGVGLLFSVVGLRAGMANFSGITLGLVMSAYYVGFVVGTYVCPLVIRRVGHIRAFAAMASVASTMPIFHAMWVDPWFWGGLRLVTGVCLVGLYMAMESWLNTVAPAAQRGKVFGAYMTVNFVALALGQWLILVGDRLGFVPFAMVSVMFSLALIPITLTAVDEPEPVPAPRLSLRNLYDASPLGVASVFASGILSGAFFGMGASYAQGVGLDDSNVASFMAATILGGALFQWPVGHYSDTHDRRVVLAWVSTVAAALAVAAYFAPQVWPVSLMWIGLAYGGMIFAIYGLAVAHVNDVIDSSRLLEFTGGLLLVHGAGSALGPTLAGLMMDSLGAASLMLFFAAVLVALALFTLKRMRAAAPIPTEDKAEFVLMGGGSQAVLQMDPRALPTDDEASAPAPTPSQTG
jgi:MFS family permease